LALLAAGGCAEGEGPASAPPPGSTPVTPAAAPASAATGPHKLLFITNGTSDWWSAVEKGIRDAEKGFGVEATLNRNDKGSTEGQIALIEKALSLPDVKGVAISVLEADSPGIADKMRDLQAAGKVVIAIDSDGQPDTRRAYIGTNNRKAGMIAGKAAAVLRPKGGETAVFVGKPSAANAIERREGFFEGAGSAFLVAEVFQDDTDLHRAQSNVATALTKFPNLGVLLGLWSYNAPRIAEEMGKSPALRKKITVVSFDLDEQAIEHIEKGRIDVSVCQNPYEMGYQGVRLLKAYLDNDKKTIEEMLPKGATTIDTGVRVIVPSKDSPIKGDNVIDIKAMKEWLASKGLESS
jgi:ribose transport system substrate-binding protein